MNEYFNADTVRIIFEIVVCFCLVLSRGRNFVYKKLLEMSVQAIEDFGNKSQKMLMEKESQEMGFELTLDQMLRKKGYYRKSK